MNELLHEYIKWFTEIYKENGVIGIIVFLFILIPMGIIFYSCGYKRKEK